MKFGVFVQRSLVLALLTSGFALTGCESTQSNDATDGDGAVTVQDPSGWILAPGKWHTTNLKPGWYIDVKTTSSTGEQSGRIAVVGESADGMSWYLEQQAQGYQGYILGLTVNKEDGMVTRAVCGMAGSAGTEIKIGEIPPSEGEPDSVTLAMGGPYEANKYSYGDGASMTWIGSEGELAGIMLRQEVGTATTELNGMPSADPPRVRCGNRGIDIRSLAWTNGDTQVLTTDEIVAALSAGTETEGTAKRVMSGTKTLVTRIGDDAQPELAW